MIFVVCGSRIVQAQTVGETWQKLEEVDFNDKLANLHVSPSGLRVFATSEDDYRIFHAWEPGTGRRVTQEITPKDGIYLELGLGFSSDETTAFGITGLEVTELSWTEQGLRTKLNRITPIGDIAYIPSLDAFASFDVLKRSVILSNRDGLTFAEYGLSSVFDPLDTTAHKFLMAGDQLQVLTPYAIYDLEFDMPRLWQNFCYFTPGYTEAVKFPCND